MGVVFATPDVGRVFIGCRKCKRVVPHYRVFGRLVETDGRCKCGSGEFSPTHITELRAAWWVLVVGWLWRKTIHKKAEWDPRMPVRQEVQ